MGEGRQRVRRKSLPLRRPPSLLQKPSVSLNVVGMRGLLRLPPRSRPPPTLSFEPRTMGQREGKWSWKAKQATSSVSTGGGGRPRQTRADREEEEETGTKTAPAFSPPPRD